MSSSRKRESQLTVIVGITTALLAMGGVAVFDESWSFGLFLLVIAAFLGRRLVKQSEERGTEKMRKRERLREIQKKKRQQEQEAKEELEELIDQMKSSIERGLRALEAIDDRRSDNTDEAVRTGLKHQKKEMEQTITAAWEDLKEMREDLEWERYQNYYSDFAITDIEEQIDFLGEYQVFVDQESV